MPSNPIHGAGRADWSRKTGNALTAMPAILAGVILLVIVLGYGMHSLSRTGAPVEREEALLEEDGEREPVGHHRVGEWDGDRSFGEAPPLRSLVEAGELPPVEERLPKNPLVIHPPERTGPYGGNWNVFATGPEDISAMTGITYETLIRWDPLQQELLPNLAVDWEVRDDGRTYVFELREGVRWSDGEPFTSKDILFWYEQVLSNPDLTPAPHRAFIRDGEMMEMEAPDERTVVFRFAKPHGLFLHWLAEGSSEIMMRFAAHYFRDLHPDFVDDAELNRRTVRAGFDAWYQYFEDKAEWRNIERPTIGAWLIRRPPPARRILFDRNPYYWKVDPEGNQLPYIDRKTYQIAARETMNLNFIRGDMGMQHRHVVMRNYSLLMEHQSEGDYRVNKWISTFGSGVLMPNLNHRDPEMRKVIADRRFRIALSHAIDREEISEAVYFGLGRPMQLTPIHTSPIFDESHVAQFTEYDPEKANRLLDEMGLEERNKDGIRLLPDGTPLRLSIEFFQLIADHETLQLVADHWSKVGIDAEARQLARSLFYTRMPARMHDVAVGGNSSIPSPLLHHGYFVPYSQAARHALSYAAWFMSDGERGERPPEPLRRAMEYYQEIMLTADQDEHTRLGRKIQEINIENLWFIGLIGDLPGLTLVKNSFRNVPDQAVILGNAGVTAPECYSIEEK